MRKYKGKAFYALVAIIIVVLVLGVNYWRSHSKPSFPSTSDPCFEMLQSSLEAAKGNPAVEVPDFSIGSIQYVRCAGVPGMIAFTIAGDDSFGKHFQIYETAGGRAASGADSIFDYCYVREGETVSQIRITGREGKRTDSACTYDESLLPQPSISYTYGS